MLGVLAAGLMSLIATPTYTAHTKLFVAIQGSGTVTELQQGNTFSQARVQSYVQTVETPVVLQPVIESLGLSMTPAELATQIEASAELDTVLINIAVSDPSPAQSAAIARAVADSLIDTVGNLESSDAGGSSPVRLSVVTPAAAPTSPASPNVQLNVALGLLLGLASGAGIALVKSGLDTRVRGEDDLKKVTDAGVLGTVAFDAKATKRPLLTHVDPQSPRAESFRQVRTNLEFARVGHSFKSILVTSSVPGEGKSITAVNLAITMSQSGQSVVLIEADLRRPMISEYLGLERDAGLTTALVGAASLEDLLQPWGPDRLSVLASGVLPPNPSEMLGSEAMNKLIAELESNFDAVIIDAPPLLPVTDAAVLAQRVGGVILIVDSQQIRAAQLGRAVSSLEMVGASVTGVVMNKVPAKGPDAYSYAYTGYGAVLPKSGDEPSSKVERKSRRAIRISKNDDFALRARHGRR